MKFLARWLPQSGWKRRVVLTLLAGMATLVLLVATVVIAFQFGPVRMWFFSHFMVGDLNRKLEPPPEPSLKAGQLALLSTNAAGIARAADFYNPTSVWSVHFHFTSNEWVALGPKKVPAIHQFIRPDGTVILRNPQASRAGIAGVLGIDLPWSTGRVDIGNLSFTNAGIRFKGNGTFLAGMSSYKRPLKVELDRQEKGRALFGRTIFNFGNLLADRSMLSDALAYEYCRQAGVPSPRTTFSRVLLSIDGRFSGRLLGLYVSVENPDPKWAQEQFGVKGVALFKPVTMELFSDLGTDWKPYEEIYDPKGTITTNHQQQVIDLARLVTHGTDTEFQNRIGSFIDLEAFARFLACEVLLSNYDGFLSNGQNFLFYIHPTTGLIGFIPWDLDHAWGEFSMIGTAESRERSDIWNPWVGKHRFLERMMKVERFRALYKAELKRQLETVFIPQRLAGRLDELAGVIRPFVSEESTNRLDKMEQAISSTWPEGPRDGNAFDENRPVFPLKRFFKARAESVSAQLEGRAKGIVVVREQQK